MVERSGARPKIKVFFQSEVPNFPPFLALFGTFPTFLFSVVTIKTIRKYKSIVVADRSDGVSGPDMARNVEGCGYELHLELTKDLVTQDDDSFDE